MARPQHLTLALPPQLTHGVVHVIDDDLEFSAAMAGLLRCAGLTCHTYPSGDRFLATYEPQALECAILDLRMPGVGGFELQEILLARHQRLQIIVVSAFGTTSDVVQAVRSGALNFLEKPVDEEALISTVTTALLRDEQRKRLSYRRDQSLSKLTPREQEIVNLLVAAKTTIRIAHLLDISPKTVERHRAHIFEKTGVDSVPSLIRLVLELN